MNKFEKSVKIVNEYKEARKAYYAEQDKADACGYASSAYWDACERYEEAMDCLNWWAKNCPEFAALYYAEVREGK